MSNEEEQDKRGREINLSDSSDDGIDDDEVNGDVGSDDDVGLKFAGQIGSAQFENKNVFANEGRFN